MLGFARGSEFKLASWREQITVIVFTLVLLGALTAALAGLQNFVDVGTVTIIYLIAVLFAAIRGGVVPAVVAAVAAIGLAAFFFYAPIYDFRVHNPVHLIDLALFIVVAVVTGKLATDVRKAKMREEADALREALIGSVSHELRTPLSSILGSASVLAQTPEVANHPQLSLLASGLSREAERLNDHIQNLLDATRISSEGIRPHAQWVDLGDIVNTAVERKSRMLADHRLDVRVADELPLVLRDPMLIEKALGHLLENAVKYSPPGSPITVVASKDGGIVRIAVQDRGVGLSADERERIWDRFYRSPRHRDSIGGSGLGLWIARSLVTASGGTVEAFSAGIGRGTTLSINLPVPERDPSSGMEAPNE